MKIVEKYTALVNLLPEDKELFLSIFQNQFYLNFSISYFSANLARSSSGRDLMYLFQPGQYFVCHLHIRPKNDFGLLSYCALKMQSSHFCISIISPLINKFYIISRSSWLVIFGMFLLTMSRYVYKFFFNLISKFFNIK